jgi:dTDP-glucose pyrophosphorylase
MVCIEEIAWRKGLISLDQLREMGRELSHNECGDYLLHLAGVTLV